MDQRAMRVRDPRHLGDRLDHAGLVVGEHDATTSAGRGSATACRSSAVEIDDTIAVDRDDAPAAGTACSTESCSIAETSTRSRPLAEQRQVIGFGAAAGEDHPVRRRADQRRDLLRARVSTIRRAARPKRCTEDGLPHRASAATIAASASGRSGAVALQSR